METVKRTNCSIYNFCHVVHRKWRFFINARKLVNFDSGSMCVALCDPIVKFGKSRWYSRAHEPRDHRRWESRPLFRRILFARKVIMQNVGGPTCRRALAKGVLIWWHCRVLGLGWKLKAYLAQPSAFPPAQHVLARYYSLALSTVRIIINNVGVYVDDDVADCLNVDSVPLSARQILSSSARTFFLLLLL